MIEITCNDRLGKKVRVKCNPDDTIGDLKKLIAAQTGTKHEKIVLKKWYTIYKDPIRLSDCNYNCYCKTPKTDYTYSELSPHRRQLAPGIVAMPNMSRRSLEHHDQRVNYMVDRNPAQEEFIRRRYQANYTHLNYDSADELDNTQSNQQVQTWWLLRVITSIVSSISSVWTSIANISETESSAYQNYYAKRDRQPKHGLIVSSLLGLMRYIYIGIASVLSLDTWLLRSNNPENKWKKRFLLFLLLLLPVLMVVGVFYYLHPHESFPPRKIRISILELPEIPKIDIGAYLNVAQFETLRSQAIDQAVRVRDWADDYLVYLRTIGQNVVSKGRWQLLPAEQRLELAQRTEALLPLPLTAFDSLRGGLLQASAALMTLWLPREQQEAAAIRLNVEQAQQSMQKSLTPEEYENILNHVNSYVQQLVELKLQQQAKEQLQQRQQLSPQQIQIIVKLMRENLQQFADQRAQLSEQQLADLVLRLKLELQQSGEWQGGQAKLTSAQLEEITRLVKAEFNLKEEHYTLLLERIDVGALLERLLGSAELAEFVDARINVELQQQQQAKEEGSGQSNADQQIEQLNREIAFIKLALSDKQTENADLQQSISNLKLTQDDLLARMQQHALAQDQRFSGLLAEIEAKLAALNESQFTLLNKQVKLTLVEILGFKQTAGGKLDDLDLQNWVRSMFVAKDYLEQQLLELNEKTNNNIRAEIERSSLVLMSDISERLKREILLVVEAKQNASSQSLKALMHDDEVRNIVKSVLAIYDADKTGLVDFALESAGGQILSTRCTESYQTKSAQISVFGIPLWYPTNTPRVAISPNVQPGECWAFQGFPGFLVLKLNSMVHVTGFTLEHIPKSLSPTGRIDSAPRNFTVWGLEHEKDQDPVLFGEYEYQDNGASLQFFPVQNMDIKRPYEIVELRIESNHGQPDYTCLYRFRVHGKPPPSS
ncbi:hypothetical protein AWZ03_003366 [Drosophila navojoa]|uniref:Ubiquitin-like protein 5 n=1 Tax=Drosophila navojoa TaxID=7232 RepID=A0A484BQ22_DRONA|nr:hypothetical protein AWZ03_003366 [Drosophila navojoa]